MKTGKVGQAINLILRPLVPGTIWGIKMKKKIADFYKDKGFEVPKLCRAKPRGINNLQVQAAATDLYYEIKRGLEIKDLNVPRRIFELAKTVEYKEFMKDQEILEHSKEIIERLKDQRLGLCIILACALTALGAALLKIGGYF